MNPILIGPDNVIVAGHARSLAARKLSLREVPVIVLAHLSEAQRRALVIADNQLALSAGWDEELLRAELADLQKDDFNLDLLGFDDGELARLLAAEEAGAGGIDPDAVPTAPPVPVTVAGDLWRLGDHRLLCGDAIRPQTIETVLAGEGANMVFTDPPYNLPSEALRIGNDPDFSKFLRQACNNMLIVCHGALYVCIASQGWDTLLRAFTEAGGHPPTFLIWAHQDSTPGQSDYQHQYEPILYGWREGVDRYWSGARAQGDVWLIPGLEANGQHPTMKPVALVERAVENSSRAGDTVLDPFAGSGSTLIACERQRRRARVIEIEPRYADVICQRWQQYTGRPAVLDSDKRTFQDVAQGRQKKAEGRYNPCLIPKRGLTSWRD